MREILKVLASFQEFNIFILDERVMFDVPVDQWPRCHCLIAYHSKGYPLEKVSVRFDQSLHHLGSGVCRASKTVSSE
jgi:hypothetical protein